MDPKSVFCAFFKQGLCKKGDKCKFSHDPTVERKSAKRNLYADENADDNMDDWDDEKLAEVVNKKHGAEKTNQTDIVSFKKICIINHILHSTTVDYIEFDWSIETNFFIKIYHRNT